MIVSKNGISCSLLLNENLMVGCILLARYMKSSSACLPWPHIIKMSSTNLSHIFGFLGDVSVSWVCAYFMNMFAYEGAILVPIAVPCICLYNLLLKVKYFFVNTQLASLHINSFFMGSVLVSSKILFRACMPLVWGMLVYNNCTSVVTNMSSGANFFPSSICIKCVVSFR